jgi:class 3 adenylate cyclase
LPDCALRGQPPEMAEERARHRLAAILAADVVGSSRLMQHDEAGTLAALKARRSEVLQPVVSRHHGLFIACIPQHCGSDQW